MRATPTSNFFTVSLAAVRRRGFALVVTLALLVLLTVIALGLLTLSTISLRASGQAEAMATARSNARVALMLAIGELQKSAGPDKAVTAPSGISAAIPKKSNLTGVWDSWDWDVKSSSLDYDGPKTRSSQSSGAPGFKGWLVSDNNLSGLKERNYSELDFSGEIVELVGDATLGGTAEATEKVWAGKVRLTQDATPAGNLAWHVADEALKARINTYRDASGKQTLSLKRALQAGHRPDVSVMKNSKQTKLDSLPTDIIPAEYTKALASTGKIVSLNQAELFDHTFTVRSFRNDVTPYSLGLLTNVREGGLKQDLTSIFELTSRDSNGALVGLPAEFGNNRKLYQTNVYSNGTAVTGVSDPYWSALAGYYDTYKDLLAADSGPILYGAPAEVITLGTPPTQPQQYAPAPVIVKVELLFCLLVRDKHGPWKNPNPPADYMLHMLYIPIITLHNPYNVNLQFDRMKIGLANVPVGFTFFVNGEAKYNMTSLSDLFVNANARGNKQFWMELADWPSATATEPSGSIVMRPGQTVVFGPYINAEEAFGDNNASYFDYGNNKTGTEASPLKSKRGFAGAGVGFDVDWLKGGVLHVNSGDLIAAEFKAMAPVGASHFMVSATLTSKGVTKSYGGMDFTYNTQEVLDRILPDSLRYPKTETGISAESMHAVNSLKPGEITQARAFALFSAYARTCNGGVDGTGSRTPAAKSQLPDGRLAGNPFLHHNPARVVISSDLSQEKPASQSHELNLVALNGSADDAFSVAADFRTNALVNYKQVAGKSIKSGSYLEIPSGPLQAIADFRRSNVLASPFLPAFVQPIGNSYASPLLDTRSVIQAGAANYQLLDHSVLANHALYDRTYFSTFAPSGSTTAAAGFLDFMKENKPLRSQVFQAYLPAGRTVDAVKKQLFASNGKPTASAYKIAAQYQMVKGPFNVNSTRVQAWKAMLSSMNHSQLNTLWAKSGLLASTASSAIPITAMTLHNGSSTRGTFTVANIDDQAANEWNGHREFSESEIEKLATEIVKQVRLRGPFLSMSEFVNRRLGSDSTLTRTGALQNAIDDSKLNDTAFKSQISVTEGHVAEPNLYGFKTPKAATGNPAAGAPGWLCQADILKILEPAATVRSDTFVIRTCGETIDNTGKVLARAYAEAVVQRVPEYVNPLDPASAKTPNPKAANEPVDPAAPRLAAPDNIAFGRRFVIVSFKWLAANEI